MREKENKQTKQMEKEKKKQTHNGSQKNIQV